MAYEPGSPECRVLIDCKGQIESMLLVLGRIDNSQHIRDQLVSVHNQLEGLHALHRKQSPPQSEHTGDGEADGEA